MKLRFLLLLLFLDLIPQVTIPQQPQEPLSKNQVMALVQAGMETSELLKLIHDHGIDFDLTDDYLQAISKAGAQEPVIQALRAARPKPLTQEQIMRLVAGHVPSQRAASLVMQHGIDFLPDEEYFKTLRLAGADDTLISALREGGAKVMAELVVITSPDAEVYLDGELKGHANAQGELTLRARPGAHELKVKLSGRKDFQQNATLTPPQRTKVEARLEAPGPAPGTVLENPKDGLRYVWIPPGTFTMGCSPWDNACQSDEKPPHEVTITNGFWLGQTEVTVGAYRRFAGVVGRKVPDVPGSSAGGASENKPIVYVTWSDAQDYCGWAGGRLPTEAQWEYAARGGSTEARYGPIDEIAWYGSGANAHDVGQKRANGFGLFDVLGNVWEFVSDEYDPDYYRHSPSQDPAGPATGESRIIRGGSWHPDYIRVSRRYPKRQDDTGSDVGIRCLWDASGH